MRASQEFLSELVICAFVLFSWHWNLVFIMYVNLYAKMTNLNMKYLYSCPELKEIKQVQFSKGPPEVNSYTKTKTKSWWVKDKKFGEWRLILLVQYMTSLHGAFKTLRLRFMGLLQMGIVKYSQIDAYIFHALPILALTTSDAPPQQFIISPR